MKIYKEHNEIYISKRTVDYQFILSTGSFNQMLPMRDDELIDSGLKEITKEDARMLFKSSKFLEKYIDKKNFDRKVKDSIKVIETIEKIEADNKKVLSEMTKLKEYIHRKQVYCVYKNDALLNQLFDLLLNESKSIAFLN